MSLANHQLVYRCLSTHFFDFETEHIDRSAFSRRRLAIKVLSEVNAISFTIVSYKLELPIMRRACLVALLTLAVVSGVTASRILEDDAAGERRMFLLLLLVYETVISQARC
jgi:hypothetical protein